MHIRQQFNKDRHINKCPIHRTISTYSLVKKPCSVYIFCLCFVHFKISPRLISHIAISLFSCSPASSSILLHFSTSRFLHLIILLDAHQKKNSWIFNETFFVCSLHILNFSHFLSSYLPNNTTPNGQLFSWHRNTFCGMIHIYFFLFPGGVSTGWRPMIITSDSLWCSSSFLSCRAVRDIECGTNKHQQRNKQT